MHHLLRMLLLVALSAPIAGQAVTLGEARVKSFLNQPLNAEIDLIGLAAGQHEDLRLRMANDKQFERLGIAYTQFLSTLTFDVAQMDGRWTVRARSTQPVTEPFIEFPLQMTWPGGQLIRHYALLFDPPHRIQTAQVTPPRQAKAPAAPVRSTEHAGSSSYGPVRSGETLWPIAKGLKPQGITTRQMAVALLRANPHAFVNGNMNRLRAGATLSIPQRSFIEEFDASAARAEFSAQTRQWQPPVATSPRTMEAPVSRTPAPQPNAESAAQKPEAEAAPHQTREETRTNQAQLRILTEEDKTEVPAGSPQNLQKQLLVTMEEIESNKITTDAIEARLSRMESELGRMQKLVELKDAQIAALQAEAAARAAIQVAAQTAEPPPPPAASPVAVRSETGIAPKTPAPISITRIEPLPTDTTPAARPWYEEYLWLIWAVLGLLGIAALLMLMRRPQPAATDAGLAQLPEVESTPNPAFEAEPTSVSQRLQEAEEDFRRMAEQQRVDTSAGAPESEHEEELPELDISTARKSSGDIDDGITESLLNDVLNDSKLLSDDKKSIVRESDFSDDDIASWVAELDNETEPGETRSANDERIPLDDDIPGILTELDDQLSTDKPSDIQTPASIQLDPVTGPVEDDTFSMSLDLARAYLEIGDQEGARDMLKQALSGARDPDHRRQIEELLQQID